MLMRKKIREQNDFFTSACESHMINNPVRIAGQGAIYSILMSLGGAVQFFFVWVTKCKMI